MFYHNDGYFLVRLNSYGYFLVRLKSIGYFLVRLNSVEDRDEVLYSGPYIVGNGPIILKV